MFLCYICNARNSNVSTIIKHLHVLHGLYDNPKLNLKCCSPPCRLNFKTFSGLRRHLQSHYIKNHSVTPKELATFHTGTEIQFMQTVEGNENMLNDAHQEDDDDDVTNETESNMNDFMNIDTILHIFFNQIMVLHLPQTQCQVIYDAILELIDNILQNILNSSGYVHNNFSFYNHINVYRQKIDSALKTYSSSYKRNKILNSKVNLPKEIYLGTRKDNVFNKVSNTYVEANIPITFQYIPILDTLKSLISQNRPILDYIATSRNIPCRKDLIMHGSFVQNNVLLKEKKYFVKIQLFYDDFETVNPLGSKAGAHKLGAIYFTIENLPLIFNTCLQHIHLVALFYVSDLKTYSILGDSITLNDVLKPIVNDIQTLETEGIQIENLDEKIFGTITSLSHDNLAANTLHGMIESFQGHFYCRMCLTCKTDIQNIYSDRNVIYRTSELYEEHSQLTSADHNTYGIKHRSILNDLNYFKLCDSMSVDIMHDILEGAVPYELKLFFNYLIRDVKVISLNSLNERLHLYDFGTLNMCNKPSPLNLDKPGHLIGQKASQSWCLIRYLPLIIDDLITHECKPIFNVILLLLQIMSITFASRISSEMVDELENLIEMHHRVFKSTFNSNIIPKQHFMIHYPSVIRRMGPLINLWCMRYESKHNVLKRMATKLHNYKNLTKTLSQRHQQLTATSGDLLTINIQYSPSKSYELENYLYADLIIEGIANFDLDTKITTYKWIKCGHEYGHKMLLCVGKNSFSLPQFNEIIDIFTVESKEFKDQIFFVTKKWTTVEFDENLHAYYLKLENNVTDIVEFNFLIYTEPYNLSQCYSSTKWYIVPKYKFVF